eukprot:TRINITY_DN629_c0_g2_i2.p2 TRINITY_DN629_c0_g2~~TRINITY_DN629_c0_g2_i2.p2  ORF type:complete len:146 (+),score=22.25 TRINITY_DN629_c0_g2_i2:611-1048(+)
MPGWVSRVAHLPFSALVSTWWDVTVKTPGGYPQWREYFWDTIENPLGNVPMLFFYSEDDPITSSKDIDALITRLQKRKDVYVDSLRWKHSQHVQHFRKHAVEYANKAESFLKHCLTLYKAGQSGRMNEGGSPQLQLSASSILSRL